MGVFFTLFRDSENKCRHCRFYDGNYCSVKKKNKFAFDSCIKFSPATRGNGEW